MPVLRGVLTLLIALAASTAAAQDVWELQPCRIQLWIATDASPYWTAARVSQLQDGLAKRADALAGGVWKLEMAAAPETVARRARAGLAWLDRSADVQSLVRQIGYPEKGSKAEPRDKVIVLYLKTAERGFEMESREWDAYTALWGPAITRRAESSAALLQVAFSALEASCGGVARVKANDDGTATLRIRGGNVPTRDPALAPVQRGDVLRLLKRNPTADVPRSTPVEWTYLSVDNVEGAVATCSVYSQFKQPLAQTLAPREQWTAIVVSPPQKTTRLRLKSNDPENPQPLSGYELVSYAPGKSPTSIGRTDHRGEIVVPPAASALRVLLVKSGQELLLRLPMIPGWQREVEVQLTSDDARLAAEGVASTFEQQLLEAATRREILLALARARISAGQNGQAQQFLEQAQGFEQTRAQLEQQIQQAKSDTKVADNIAAEKVNAMFDRLLESVNRHLGSAPIQQISAQLASGSTQTAPPQDPVTPTDPGTTPDPGTERPPVKAITPGTGRPLQSKAEADGRVRYIVLDAGFTVTMPADSKAVGYVTDVEIPGSGKKKITFIQGSSRGTVYTAGYISDPNLQSVLNERTYSLVAIAMGADYQIRLKETKASKGGGDFMLYDCYFEGNLRLQVMMNAKQAYLFMIGGPFDEQEWRTFRGSMLLGGLGS